MFLLVAFCAVLFAYVADIIDLTDSMFVSYPFAVYSVAFVLSCLLPADETGFIRIKGGQLNL